MNGFQISTIVIIATLTILFEISILVFKKWPWQLFSFSSNNLPEVDTNAIPAGKMCDISGTIIDYQGKSLTKSEVLCTDCISYRSSSSSGCKAMKYNGSKCGEYGDPRPC
jgi:hypothetical protein